MSYIAQRRTRRGAQGYRAARIADRGAAPRRSGLSALGDLLGSFSDRTEQWRDLVTQYAGDIPVDFLMAWISRESDGDPCSYTSMGESGIFQLMPPDNINAAGTSIALLRAACSGSSQTPARALTDAEKYEQVRSGIQYVNYLRGVAHAKLSAAGVPWDDESTADFWKFVKLQHAYPGPSAGWLANAATSLGQPAQSWDDMRSTISGYQSVLDNADWVGSYGGGLLASLPSLNTPIAGIPASNYLVAGLLGYAAYTLLS
jgi:hypothetical protein